jgi:hypothetical protein
MDHDAAAGKPMMSVGEEREILSPEITQIGRVRTRGSAIGAMNCDGNCKVANNLRFYTHLV